MRRYIAANVPRPTALLDSVNFQPGDPPRQSHQAICGGRIGRGPRIPCQQGK
jgi:hypothetical protein